MGKNLPRAESRHFSRQSVAIGPDEGPPINRIATDCRTMNTNHFTESIVEEAALGVAGGPRQRHRPRAGDRLRPAGGRTRRLGRRSFSNSACGRPLPGSTRRCPPRPGGSLPQAEVALPPTAAALRRLRGRGRRQARQEDGRLPPVPRRQPGPGRHAEGDRPRRRPPRRRGVAHAGVGQEPDDGVRCRPRDPRRGHEKPDHRGPHRPQRPRRPVVRHLRPLQGTAAPAAGSGREPRPLARTAQDRLRRRHLHHGPQVLPHSGGDEGPAALGHMRNALPG